jgi:hypothetical protein
MADPKVRFLQQRVYNKKGQELKPSHQRVEEDNRFQPWEVTLYIRKNAIDPRLYATCYYVRAPRKRPELAMAFAHRLWQKYERLEKGFEDWNRYPDAEEKADVEEIREVDYAKAWRDAQKYIFKFVGPPENPSGFTFFPPGHLETPSDVESSAGVDEDWLRLPE